MMTNLGTFRTVQSKALLAALSVAGILGAALAVSSVVAAQDSTQQVDAQRAKKLAKGEQEAKKMLLLMDTDKSGKVSKQEFMSFMEAEFERLDINKDGELDVKELTESRVQVRTRGR